LDEEASVAPEITHGLLILEEPLDLIQIALIESKSGHVVGTCRAAPGGGSAPEPSPWRASSRAMASGEVATSSSAFCRRTARVAEELLASLEGSDEDVAAAWVDELERRSRERAEGTIVGVPWDEARTEILAELKRRRCG
jgi:hypothetical protein